MNELEKKLAEFPFRFPPAKRKTNAKRNKKAATQVPDQPEIEYLLLRVLADHLKISVKENMWQELALVLARHIFPEPDAEGAPLKWDKKLSIILIGEIQRHMKIQDKSKGTSYASGLLAKQEYWIAHTDSESPSARKELLRKRYQALKKQTEFFNEALMQYKCLTEQGEWSHFVASHAK